MDRSNLSPPTKGENTRPPKVSRSSSSATAAQTPSARGRRRSERRGCEKAMKASEARQRLAGWALVHALETFFAELLAAHGGASASEWIDQEQSPLGKWRHLKLVREGKIP